MRLARLSAVDDCYEPELLGYGTGLPRRGQRFNRIAEWPLFYALSPRPASHSVPLHQHGVRRWHIIAFLHPSVHWCDAKLRRQPL